jgi:hypothetical protein
MPTQGPSISNCEFSIVGEFLTNAGVFQGFNIGKILGFTNISLLKTYQGTFSPANNFLLIDNYGSQVNAPNFLVIVSDSQLNIIDSIGTDPFNMSVNNLAVIPLVDSAATFVDSIYIDGRTIAGGLVSTLVPMPQGVPVDFYILAIRATVSVTPS